MMPPQQAQQGAPQAPPQLQALQDSIDNLHQLMSILPDAADTQVVAKCLAALTGIQNKMMSQGGGAGDPQQAMLSQLAGQGADGGQSGPGGIPPELLALLAQGGGGGQPQY